MRVHLDLIINTNHSLQNSYSRDNEGRFGYDTQHSLQNNIPENFIQMRGGGQYFAGNFNVPPHNYRGRTDNTERGYAGRRYNSRHDHGNQRVRASPYFVPSQNSSPHINNDWVNPSFPGQNAGNQIQTDEIATLNLRIAELIKSNSDMALRYDTLAKSNAEMSIRFDEMQSRVNRVGSGSSSLSTQHQDLDEFSDGENSAASGNTYHFFLRLFR